MTLKENRPGLATEAESETPSVAPNIAATDFAALLETLGYTDDKHVSVCWQRAGQGLEYVVLPPKAAAVAVMQTADTSNVWYSVNPTKGPPRNNNGRGDANDATRLASLYADLDVKPGGCPSFEVARQIIDDVSAMLGTRPSAIVHSGHGCQPYWPVEDGAVSAIFAIGDAAALLRRFGRLVKLVAESRGAKVDNVYDLARILRAPGTVNNKAEPVPVTFELDNGAPLTVEQVDERLTELGIHAGDDDELSKEPVSTPDAWAYADQPCRYVTTMVAGWATDTPAARHPWLVSQAVRLAAAYRRTAASPEKRIQRQSGCWNRVSAHWSPTALSGVLRSPARTASPPTASPE